MKLGEGRKIEFIAKSTMDVGKAVFVVGLASRFFEQFSNIWLRIVISFLSMVLIFVGVFLFPNDGGRND